MRAIILPAFALALGAGFLAAPQEAQARFGAAQLEAPTLVDNVACVTRRIRTVQQGVDGALYVTTDNGGDADQLLRVTPR